MSYKCRICGTNDVEHQGDVCELCAIGQDPYASAFQNYNNPAPEYKEVQSSFPTGNAGSTDTYVPGKGKNRKILLGGGSELSNLDPYGNSMTLTSDPQVQVYQPGQVPNVSTSSNFGVQVLKKGKKGQNGSAKPASNEPLTSGITKNINVDNQRKSALVKLFRTLFTGIPYTLDNEITMFQVFPDFTGTSLNAMGNACDQVIVYGKLNAGAVSENNDVEVYGHRDTNNNIVAKKIVNKASGTVIRPERVIPVAVVWLITIAVFAALAFFITTFGVEGIIWSVILVLCLTHLSLVFKIFLLILGAIFSFIRRLFR